MSPTLLLYAHLLVFMIGTLLYGFLTRELLRNPSVLPGLPIRLLVGCLTLWYAGCLIDELIAILNPYGGEPTPFAAVFDIVRAMAWLASLPLLANAIWRLLPATQARGTRGITGWLRPRRPDWFWLIPGYLTLLLFVPAAWEIWLSRSPFLERSAQETYPLILIHAALSVAVSGWMLLRVMQSTDDERLREFLKWLLPALLIMFGLLSLGSLLELGGGRSATTVSIWRLSSEASGLVLGLTFLYFVQRYNLLRLSLSHRSLRHFAAVLAVVLLVMLYGPAEGIEETQLFRRFLAFGLVAAMAIAVLYTPLRRAAVSRSTRLRRLLGESYTPQEIDAFTSRLESLDLSEQELTELVAERIGDWLVTRARFLGAKDGGEREHELLRRHFQNPAATAFNRLDPPSRRFAAVLGRTHLHAAFPLRVGGELEAVLGLEVSATGGGYQDGEMEAVQLVLRQLGSVLQLRRLAEIRVAEERRLAERERLSMLGMVSASLVHEVKNPLSSIKVLAETVREEIDATDPGSEQVEDLRLIVDQIERLNGVAHDILGFARAPQTDTSSTGVDLSRLVLDTLAVVRFRAKGRNVGIDDSGVEEVGRVRGSAAGWQTVLLNLINNAVEHAPAGSSVKVRLATADGRMVFETENGGPAMTDEIAGRLFEPFVSDGGTGLGLGLVAQRISELGGRIEVDNEPERIVFRVTAPAFASGGGGAGGDEPVAGPRSGEMT